MIMNTIGGLRKALDALESSSTSFHHQSLHQQSLNTSAAHNHSTVKTPTRSKTPNNKSVNKSGGSKSGSRSGSAKKNNGGDRFLPDRSNFEMAHYLLQQPDLGSDKDKKDGSKSSKSSEGSTGSGTTTDLSQFQPDANKKENSIYSRSLTETMLGVSDLASTRVLSFVQKPKGPPEGYQNPLKVVYQGSTGVNANNFNKYRVIPKMADKVLDAPDIVDDFYLNLLAWSQQNVVAIALKDQVYLWTAHTAEINKISCDKHDDKMQMATSVGWVENGIHLAVALDTGNIQIWDTERLKLIRTLKTDEPDARIAALAINAHNLVQGNRLGTIRNHDLRVQTHETCTIKNAHTQEICGVKFNCDGRFLATGGNDNMLNVWDFSNMTSSSRPVNTFSDHLAAVKALCWSPSHSNLLVSGGGTNDRTIKLWNVSSGSLLKSINAESQVSGLIWHDSYREILSTHGFNKNQLAIWKYPDMTKVGEVMGHGLRILHTALSPDETTVGTVGADETLRFFKVFPPTKATSQLKKTKKDSFQHFQALR